MSDNLPLLSVAHLCRDFDVSSPWLARVLTGAKRRELHAVADVSFTIAEGQTLSLVGESGCGKSTVARSVAGLLAPTSGQVTVRTPEDATDSKRAPRRRDVQMVFQDPYGSLNPRWRAGRIIADPIKAMKLATTRREIAAMVGDLLVRVGLSHADAAKFPHQFSGGQRQRIAIARALAGRPSFIVCDEPTSALDVSVQAQILNLLQDLKGTFGLTLLFISHNLAVVDHVSDVVGVMYLGRIVEIGERSTLFDRPRHPYTRMLIAAMPTLERIGTIPDAARGEVPNPIDPPSGCAFHPRCPAAISRCTVERPLDREVDGRRVACHRAEEIVAS